MAGKKVRERYKKQGLCIDCGKRPPERFRIRCRPCLNRAAANTKKYYDKKKEEIYQQHARRRQHHIENRLCTSCGVPLDNDIEKGVYECTTCVGKRVVINRINGQGVGL